MAFISGWSDYTDKCLRIIKFVLYSVAMLRYINGTSLLTKKYPFIISKTGLDGTLLGTDNAPVFLQTDFRNFHNSFFHSSGIFLSLIHI